MPAENESSPNLATLRGIPYLSAVVCIQEEFPRFRHDEGRKIQHLFERTRGHIEEQAHTGRDPLKYQMWGDRCGELDVAHAFAPHLARVTSTPHFSHTIPL